MDWQCLCGTYVRNKRVCPRCELLRFSLKRAEFLDYFGLKIGSVAGGMPFNLPLNRMSQHLLISGQSGTGKSRVAMKLAVKAENSPQIPKINLLVIDVEGEWSGIVSLFKEEPLYFEVGKNLKINPFELKDPALITSLLKETVLKGIEQEFSDLSAQMNFVLNNVITKSNNMKELIQNIVDYNDHKLTAIERTKTALLVRLDPFLRSPLKEIFLCKKSSIDFERMHENNVIINLHDLDAKVAYNSELRLIYNTISTYYLRSMLNSKTTDSLSNLVIFEEGQQLVPKLLQKLIVTDTWPATRFAVRLRKRGCGLVIITQSPSNIETDIYKNCATKITFRLQHQEDIKLITDSCGFVHRAEHQFLSDAFVKLQQREAIVTTFDKEPFLFRSDEFIPSNNPITAEGEEEDEDFVAETKKKDVSLTPDEKKFIDSIVKKPFMSRTQRKNYLRLDSFRFSNLVDSLVSKGIIEKVNVFTGKGRPQVLYQKKGQIPGIRHEFYVNYLVSILRGEGMKAVTNQIGPDIIVPEIKTAINVELGTSDIEGNLKYAMEEYDHVITCSDDQKILEKIPKIGLKTRKELAWNVPKLLGLEEAKDNKKKLKNSSMKKKQDAPTLLSLG